MNVRYPQIFSSENIPQTAVAREPQYGNPCREWIPGPSPATGHDTRTLGRSE
jgi:hypothetical protein